MLVRGDGSHEGTSTNQGSESRWVKPDIQCKSFRSAILNLKVELRKGQKLMKLYITKLMDVPKVWRHFFNVKAGARQEIYDLLISQDVSLTTLSIHHSHSPSSFLKCPELIDRNRVGRGRL